MNETAPNVSLDNFPITLGDKKVTVSIQGTDVIKSKNGMTPMINPEKDIFRQIQELYALDDLVEIIIYQEC